MDSIWKEHVAFPQFPVLEGDRHTDVAVIGGGLTGILTADALQRAGADVTVVEANRIGSGQTGGTTAKLTAQHGLKYHALIRSHGADAAAQYARVNLEAVDRLRRTVRDRRIDCDFTDCTTFLCTAGDPEPLKAEYRACRRAGMDVFLTADTELPFPAQALGLRAQARFHPLKLLAALADGLPIYERSRVLEVRDHTLRTEYGSLTARKIIFACHFPFVNFPGFYFLRQHQERSCVLALEHAAPMKHCYLGIDADALSFRPCGNYLLLGGSGYRTGENSGGGTFDALQQRAQQYWPQCRIVARWSAQDCMPMDGIPYIGPFSASRPDWLIATGFQKWGMSSGAAAAEILCAYALEQTPSAGSGLFSPRRFHLGASAKQLTADAVCSAKGLGRRLLAPARISAQELPVGHGGIVTLDGEKRGVYRDINGLLFSVTVKCPHMGCQLEWNPDEKSWDCPCHGSRFDISGQLLDGPAQKHL